MKEVKIDGLEVSQDYLRVMLADTLKNYQGQNGLLFGVWLAENALQAVYIKSKSIKNTIAQYEWVLAVRLDKNSQHQIKEDEQRKIINTVKKAIKDCLCKGGKLGKVKMYKVNSKNPDKMAFIIVPFNVTKVRPAFSFDLTWAM